MYIYLEGEIEINSLLISSYLLKWLSVVMTGRPKKLFVFVNPFGGRRSASKVFTDDVKPILDDANIEYTLQGLFHTSICIS